MTLYCKVILLWKHNNDEHDYFASRDEKFETLFIIYKPKNVTGNKLLGDALTISEEGAGA